MADRCDDSALFFIVESMQDTMTTPKTTTPAPKGRWYVIQVHSGFENKVAESIREQALEKGLDGEIFDVVVPVEEAQDVKKGTKVHTERKFFPGYVLINMIMTDPAWHMIMDNKRVVNFLGGGAKSKPVPLSKAESDRLLGHIQGGFKEVRRGVIFEIGENIRIIDGPFENFSATVEDLEESRQKLKVSVSIFGRKTPVELDYSQVEKI